MFTRPGTSSARCGRCSIIRSCAPCLIYGDQPVMRWMFGTDRPDLLLGAIEEAMVAARVPGAQGFAARALGTTYDRPPKDIPADPRLW